MAEFLPWLIRLIFFTLVLRFVLRLIAQMTRPAAQAGPRRSSGPRERAGGTLVRDPHCGTYIPITRAIRVDAGSGPQYFCSDDCRRAYLTAHPTAHSA